MTTGDSSSSSARPTASTEFEELKALVAHLSLVATEAMRLSVEVQAKLPAVLAKEIAAREIVAARSAATIAAHAAADSAATIAAHAAANAIASVSAAAPAPAATSVDSDPVFVRGTPKTPDQLAIDHPEGTGEICYVVICGREPGIYYKASDADRVCNGVPNQLKAKKTSRIDALDWYRSLYNGPAADEGVQKWVEAE
ncbi:hypothetical protein R3P38DRAFT_949215 [Favolaschia claudopus]|uniref:Uncharacterized protein n=1 Tax=Favolaschia claudopus TaxID=2862362 RepID=A0AAW0BMJ5_9AGAR